MLTDDAHRELDARPEVAALWIDAAQLRSFTGYELKPEGACRDDVCVPLARDLCRGHEIDAAGALSIL